MVVEFPLTVSRLRDMNETQAQAWHSLHTVQYLQFRAEVMSWLYTCVVQASTQFSIFAPPPADQLV